MEFRAVGKPPESMDVVGGNDGTPWVPEQLSAHSKVDPKGAAVDRDDCQDLALPRDSMDLGTQEELGGVQPGWCNGRSLA